MELLINPKYEPLFNMDNKTRYTIMTGGRGSGKSFVLALYMVNKTFEYQNKVILYTRYTMVSAEKSVIPEFWEMVVLLGLEDVFKKTAKEIINLTTGTKIFFSGLKTSSGKQTANLKSIKNFVIWVMDEAEELDSEEEFDVIDNSIRVKGVSNEIVLVLNPPQIQHFIYKKFYKGYGLKDVYNGIIEDCTFIHTSYHDNINNLDEGFLSKAEKLKIKDPEKYNHDFGGLWGRGLRGLVFKGWNKIKEMPTDLYYWYGLDFGHKDPLAIVEIMVDKNKLYLQEIVYEREFGGNVDIARALKQRVRTRKNLIYQLDKAVIYTENEKLFVGNKSYYLAEIEQHKADIIEQIRNTGADIDKTLLTIERIRKGYCEVYCDCAEPKSINEIRRCNINALPCMKGQDSIVNGIEYLKQFDIYYNGKNIDDEVNTYKWMENKNATCDEDKYLNKPEDRNNHSMDAIRYGVVTKLKKIKYDIQKYI